ncbi:hypothetical protein [Halopseudomonas pelagia]|uniref:hypothetical protein n=1 Tax=Halopseudomonas pelagia TaxID=553151 RepID=UPI001268566F|nr:hypothetical protein [Halopseudomonas pelagia]
MTTPAFSLRRGFPSAHLPTRIQNRVQHAMDERRLFVAVVLEAFSNPLYESVSGRFIRDLRDAIYCALGVRR